MFFVNARVCTKVSIFYLDHSFFHNPCHHQEVYQGVAPPRLTYLTYRWRGKQGEEETTHNRGKCFLHACVCSKHPITPVIILQSSNLSLYTMSALLHCTVTITRGKQCACCIRNNQDLYVYTLFFEFIFSFLNSFFFIAPRSKPGIPTFNIYCVSRHFLIITRHTFII